MLKAANEAQHGPRMNQAMKKLQDMSESEQSIFMRVLFGQSSPAPVAADLSSDPEFGKIEWIDPNLNDSQKDAIRFALASRDIALIHGPPGVCFPLLMSRRFPDTTPFF
jgi:DNA polymerase alpha-associated DNA helicase A